jgi:[ribosomal protein S5]-alanine N-acetyltransferase
LILREWNERDSADLFEFSKNPDIENAGCKTHESMEESLEFIRTWIKHQGMWAITLKENEKVIGWILLGDTNRYDRYKEMEYVISVCYQNKGYATETVKRVLEFAFTEMDLLVVALCHYPFNIKSKRVIEKCGFTYEGTLRKYSRNLADSVRYSMTKEEWKNLYA